MFLHVILEAHQKQTLLGVLKSTLRPLVRVNSETKQKSFLTYVLKKLPISLLDYPHCANSPI